MSSVDFLVSGSGNANRVATWGALILAPFYFHLLGTFLPHAPETLTVVAFCLRNSIRLPSRR